MSATFTDRSMGGQYGGVGPSSVERMAIAHAEGPRASASLLERAAPLDFEAVYEETVAMVWRSARRMGVPAASLEDVVQDVFLVVHRHLPEYDGRASARSWIYGIVVRVVADHRRRYRRKEAHNGPLGEGEGGEERFASSHPPPCAMAEQAEAVRLLDRLLMALDEDKREVLVLAQLEEMSVPEIAACLGANVNTIYSRLRAARHELEAAYALAVDGGVT